MRLHYTKPDAKSHSNAIILTSVSYMIELYSPAKSNRVQYLQRGKNTSAINLDQEMKNDNDLDNCHQALYYAVQEAFVENLVKTSRVAGGVSENHLTHINKGKLAELSNLSKGTITKLTSNDPQDAKPDLETLCKLGHALNVSPAFLLMTQRDWSILIQACGTLEMLKNRDGDKERTLVDCLSKASMLQKIDDAAMAGLRFMNELTGENYSDAERERQQKGILAMIAMAQAAVKRQGSDARMFAIALGAILGDREISQT